MQYTETELSLNIIFSNPLSFSYFCGLLKKKKKIISALPS